MFKKVYIIGLSILIVLSLAIPSFAALSPEPPEGATEIVIPWTARYLYRLRSVTKWYSSDRTPTVEDFYGDNGVTDDQVAVVPGVYFYQNYDQYYLQDLKTYYFEYLVTSVPDDTIDFWAYSTNIDSFRFVPEYNALDIFGDISNSLVSSIGPYEGTYIAYELGITDTAISVTSVGSSSYKVQFAFSTPLQLNDGYSISGILFPSTGYLSEPGRFQLTDLKVYSDPRGDYFEQLQLQFSFLNAELLSGILESGLLSNEQLGYVNEQLAAQQQILSDQNQLIEDQNSMLQGDPNDYQDNSGFDSVAGEYEDLEDQINDQISGNVTLPDGSSIPTNGGVFTSITSWFKNNFSPQDYESSAGNQISRVFEFFLPFVGIPILINLTLAVILSFLRGRSNA